jgi:anthranilate 1,2-dioxygenase small subunit
MIAREIRDAIADLLGEAVYLLDNDRLEDWIECFVEDCRYEIVPRENAAQQLGASLLLCENKNMLRDRIAYLRHASVYNIHVDRHVLGPSRIAAGGAAGDYRVATNYALYQSDNEGESRLFGVGLYDDVVAVVDGRARFKSRTVIVDTFAIPTLLSTPI